VVFLKSSALVLLQGDGNEGDAMVVSWIWKEATVKGGAHNASFLADGLSIALQEGYLRLHPTNK